MGLIQTENILYPIFLHCGIDFFTNLVGMNEQVGSGSDRFQLCFSKKSQY